jgi:hypothetical protein
MRSIEGSIFIGIDSFYDGVVDLPVQKMKYLLTCVAAIRQCL